MPWMYGKKYDGGGKLPPKKMLKKAPKNYGKDLKKGKLSKKPSRPQGFM